jgi:hypothetical protein
MHGTEKIEVLNASATGDAQTLLGGRYMLIATATWNSSGTVGVEALAPDGSTWVPVGNALTEDGVAVYDLGPGQYRIAIETATAVYAALTSLPL